MKLFNLLLNVAWCVLAAAEPAQAGPLLGIPALFSAIAATTIGKVVLGIVLNVAVSLLQKVLTKKPEQKAIGVKLDIEIGDDIPVSAVIGYYPTAGKRNYVATWGKFRKTPNAYLTQVIELGNLPMSKTLLQDIDLWVDDQKVTILTGETPDENGYPIKEFRDDDDRDGDVGSGIDDYAWIKFYNGTQTATDPFLLETFGDLEDRPWLATMIGRGVPYAVMTYRYRPKYFNTVPNTLIVSRGIPLYDIRKDSTNGGNGPQRWNDQSTWEPSVNAVVMTYNVIRGLSYNGDWFFGGQDLAASRLPSSNWIAAANEAGRLIEIAGQPSEPQFRAGIEITGDMEPLDVIDNLRAACNGRIAEVGGSFKIQIGAFGAAVFSFTDADIVVTKVQTFEPFPTLDDTINQINISYPNPDEKWVTKDAPALTAKDTLDPATGKTLFEVDGNRVLAADVQLPAVPFARQAQRIRRAMIKEERRFHTHRFWLPPEAWVLEPNDVIAWSSARNGYSNKKFIIVDIQGEVTMNQLVTIREIDPADYDWSPTFDLPTSSGYLGPMLVPTQPMEGWTVTATTITDANGVSRRPAIVVTAAANLDDVRSVWVKVRLKATGAIVFDSDQFPYASATGAWILTGLWLWPATEYEVQGRLVPFSARKTDPSAWISVTTADIGFSSADLIDNAVTQQKIAEAAISASKIADEAVTGVKLANQAVTTAKIALAAVTSLLISDGAVIAAKLADAAVTISKIQDGAVIASKVADGAIERDKLAAQAVDATKFAAGIQPIGVVAGTVVPTTKTQEIITVDGKLYRWTNGAYSASVPAVEISGTIISSQIADAAITAQKLAAAAIDATKFASGIRPVETVSALPTTGNVQGRTVFLTTDGKLYRYTGGSFTASVPAVDVTGQITSTQIGPDSVTTDKIAANAVTANEIAANAIVAGKIAVGAVSADQIAANAITAAKIAAGAISADKLAVGTGRNMIPNSDLRAGTTGWQANASGGDWGNPILEMRTDKYGIAGTGSLQVLQRGAQVNDQFADVSPIDPATKQIMRFPVKAGGNYEISIYAFGHRSNYVRAHVDWRDLNGNNLGYAWYDGPSHQNFDPQGQLSNYPRIGGRLNPAPAGTAFAYVFFRCWGHSAAYGVDSYTWLALPYFGECNPNQTELSPWGPAGVTLIDAGNIVTNAITADKIAAGAITVGKLAAGAVTAGTIAANAVTAGTIAVGAVSADQIAANAITAVKIAGGTITGDKLAVRTISADSLLAATITGYEIKADTITGSHIAALTVTANELAANSVVAGKLAANAVTAGTIAANAISAINIQGSTITGDKLQGATISGDKLQANTLGAREIAADSISAKQLVITNFSNLVPDNQMTSTEAWVGTIPGWIVWGDHGLFQSYNGMQFGAGPWGSGSYTNCQSRSFPVKGATSYRFTGAIYSNSNYNAFIRVLWLDANGALASYYDHASTGNRGAGGTGLQTVNLVSPVGAASAIIELFVQRNNTGGPVYFGSIGAFERNAGELIVDGAIKAAQIAADAITTAMLQAGSVTTDKLVVGGVSYDKLAARATGYLGISSNPDAFTITTAFQARVSADVTKPSQDGLEVVASFRVRCTNLGGATSASVQFRLREYLNGAYTADVEYGKVYFTDTSQDVNDVISAYLIHMKPAGPSGNYSYALEIKKNTAASDFTIGVGRIGVKLGTKTG
jgi:hypothetical protein